MRKAPADGKAPAEGKALAEGKAPAGPDSMRRATGVLSMGTPSDGWRGLADPGFDDQHFRNTILY
jgi:hypothetical protein